MNRNFREGFKKIGSAEISDALECFLARSADPKDVYAMGHLFSMIRDKCTILHRLFVRRNHDDDGLYRAALLQIAGGAAILAALIDEHNRAIP